MSDGIKSYIKQTANGMKQHLLFNRIIVYEQNPLPEEIDIDKVLRDVETKIPYFFAEDVDSVFIGQFSFLKEKDMDAMYESGAIYITNEQENDEDFLTDLVHEFAHAIEETYPLDIYGDGTIEEEFLVKRRSMAEILYAHGYNEFEPGNFEETEYSSVFDRYLYQDVGYPVLDTLLHGLFISPYGSTSLREYFGNAFEEFFAGDNYYVRSISPAVYKKLIDLMGYDTMR